MPDFGEGSSLSQKYGAWRDVEIPSVSLYYIVYLAAVGIISMKKN